MLLVRKTTDDDLPGYLRPAFEQDTSVCENASIMRDTGCCSVCREDANLSIRYVDIILLEFLYQRTKHSCAT